MKPNISGYVLAGGQSSRMGRDKSLLRISGYTLLQMTLHKLEQVCSDVSILCGSETHGEYLAPYGRVVVDRIAASGPLSGLDAALHDAREEWLLIVPVDVPLLPASALRELVSRGISNGKPNVACFDAPGKLQPLPVLLHRSTREVVTQAVQQGRRTLLPVLRDAAEAVCPQGMCVLPAEEITDELTASIWFTNVNTPDDFEAAKELLRTENAFPQRASE
ncbi:molybdenum cofactor guanylyltransferase [Terriglobus roseus]|uniref:Probable molybdenum cofactor guanylyltransferase n=1 Tax=Terriglobus roseus TaxID=392734 RepID=A0A1G7KXG7_9BACT|nr:molybdenum cofactor guanylyltransferase [Terriglobus roseus]SDF41449.1 molybdopterin-guanine dinucleotide biosynthesis protein A [Terriglobus roseus]